MQTQTSELPWEALFASRLRKYRKARQWSQGELARRATIAGLKFRQQHVDRIERGERPIRLDEAIILSGICGSDVGAMTSADEDLGPGFEQLHGILRDATRFVARATARLGADSAELRSRRTIVDATYDALIDAPWRSHADAPAVLEGALALRLLYAAVSTSCELADGRAQRAVEEQLAESHLLRNWFDSARNQDG